MESIKKNFLSWWWPEQCSKHPLMIKETLLRGNPGVAYTEWVCSFPWVKSRNWKQFQKQNSEKHLGIMSHWSSKFLSSVQKLLTLSSLMRFPGMRQWYSHCHLQSVVHSLASLVSCWDHPSPTGWHLGRADPHRILGASYDPAPTTHHTYHIPAILSSFSPNYTRRNWLFLSWARTNLAHMPWTDPFSVFCLLVLPNHHPSLSTGSFSSAYQYSQVFPI